MLNESREKQLSKFLKMSAFKAIDFDPLKFAKSFLYLFEKNGWKFNPQQAQEFVDKFRQYQSGEYSNPWFDNYNEVKISLGKSTYKECKDINLKINFKINGMYMNISEISLCDNEVSRIKINLVQSVEKVIIDIVSIVNKIGEKIIEAEKAGKSRYKTNLSHEFRASLRNKKEVELISQFLPLQTYLEKKGYNVEITLNSSEKYQFTINFKEFENMPWISQGLYFAHQFTEYKFIVNSIIKKANFIGLYLINYGQSVDDNPWMEFQILQPDKTSTRLDHVENRNKEKPPKYKSAKELQDYYVEMIIQSCDASAKQEKIINRYYMAIKEGFNG